LHAHYIVVVCVCNVTPSACNDWSDYVEYASVIN